jgi:hypothetical protein
MRKAAGTSPPAIPTEEEFTLLAIIGPTDQRANTDTSCLRLLHNVDDGCGFLVFSQSVLISQLLLLSLYEHNFHTF